jgi:hypothetical protein
MMIMQGRMRRERSRQPQSFLMLKEEVINFIVIIITQCYCSAVPYQSPNSLKMKVYLMSTYKNSRCHH